MNLWLNNSTNQDPTPVSPFIHRTISSTFSSQVYIIYFLSSNSHLLQNSDYRLQSSPFCFYHKSKKSRDIQNLTRNFPFSRSQGDTLKCALLSGEWWWSRQTISPSSLLFIAVGSFVLQSSSSFESESNCRVELFIISLQSFFLSSNPCNVTL